MFIHIGEINTYQLRTLKYDDYCSPFCRLENTQNRKTEQITEIDHCRRKREMVGMERHQQKKLLTLIYCRLFHRKNYAIYDKKEKKRPSFFITNTKMILRYVLVNVTHPLKTGYKISVICFS